MSEQSSQRRIALPRNARRHSFTLIEILTVIFIIAVLIGLLFAGMKHWGYNAANNATTTRIELLNGMLSEMEASGGHNQFLAKPFMLTGAAPAWQAIDASAIGLAAVDSAGRGTVVVDDNKPIMDLLRSLPNNVTAMNSLPSDGVVTITKKIAGVPTTSTSVADGWVNPILFVPANGLANVTVGGALVTITAPDHRAFWASAGPDGDFSKGDDNIYSFQIK